MPIHPPEHQCRARKLHGGRFSKDDANNLTTDPSNNASYAWDARNQLSSVNSPNYAFTYDAVGRREAFNNFGVLESYLYDALMAVQETSSNTQTVPTQAYLTMPGGDVLAYSATVNGTTTTSVPLHDILGSTIGLVNSSGAIATTFTYEPFGAPTPNTNAYPYLFAGMEYDAATGLYHTPARYYSPRLQRFLSEDPLNFGGGDLNLFRYVGDGPVNFVDPLGTTVYGIIGGGVELAITAGALWVASAPTAGVVAATVAAVAVAASLGGALAFGVALYNGASFSGAADAFSIGFRSTAVAGAGVALGIYAFGLAGAAGAAAYGGRAFLGGIGGVAAVALSQKANGGGWLSPGQALFAFGTGLAGATAANAFGLIGGSAGLAAAQATAFGATVALPMRAVGIADSQTQAAQGLDVFAPGSGFQAVLQIPQPAGIFVFIDQGGAFSSGSDPPPLSDVP